MTLSNFLKTITLILVLLFNSDIFAQENGTSICDTDEHSEGYDPETGDTQMGCGTFTPNYRTLGDLREQYSGFRDRMQFINDAFEKIAWLMAFYANYDKSDSHGTEGNGDATQPGGNCSNPIMVETGNKVEKEVDFRGSGENPLSIIRYYNHLSGLDGVFGENWTSNFDYKLTFTVGQVCTFIDGTPDPSCEFNNGLITTIDTISLYRPDGSKQVFTLTFGSLFEDKDGVYAKIIKNANGTFTLTESNLSRSVFNSSGMILSKSNPQGVTQTYNYASGKLSSITHQNGQALTYTWIGDFIDKITDSAGNVYDYNYFGNKLSDVNYPSGSPSSSKSYHYQDASNIDALTSIEIDGVLYATFTYNSSGAAISSAHGLNANKDKYTFNFNSTTELPAESTDTNTTHTMENPLGLEYSYNYTKTTNEPPRVYRRLHTVRGWSNENTKEIPQRS